MTVHTATGDRITAADLYALLRLRVEVFVIEQGCLYQDLDGLDLVASTRHLWLREGGSVPGCLRILDDEQGIRIGRVCTAAGARGTGVGARLMDAALGSIGDVESTLSAQTYAADFYRRFGYVPEGEEYLDDGIPHILMRRAAPPPR